MYSVKSSISTLLTRLGHVLTVEVNMYCVIDFFRLCSYNLSFETYAPASHMMNDNKYSFIGVYFIRPMLPIRTVCDIIQTLWDKHLKALVSYAFHALHKDTYFETLNLNILMCTTM